MSSDESARLIKMEETLHGRVIGQEEAVVAISRAIRRARVGLKSPNRPIASFIFSGVRRQHVTLPSASAFRTRAPSSHLLLRTLSAACHQPMQDRRCVRYPTDNFLTIFILPSGRDSHERYHWHGVRQRMSRLYLLREWQRRCSSVTAILV